MKEDGGRDERRAKQVEIKNYERGKEPGKERSDG
jgi:hypothetical protein